MLDTQGVLNPGLMPQKLADLNLLAPALTDVDDVLVERWNRVTEVWRNQPEFRNAVLRYATSNAHRDPASTGLWPEVVYPLIERGAAGTAESAAAPRRSGITLADDSFTFPTPACSWTASSTRSSRHPWSLSSMKE